MDPVFDNDVNQHLEALAVIANDLGDAVKKPKRNLLRHLKVAPNKHNTLYEFYVELGLLQSEDNSAFGVTSTLMTILSYEENRCIVELAKQFASHNVMPQDEADAIIASFSADVENDMPDYQDDEIDGSDFADEEPADWDDQSDDDSDMSSDDLSFSESPDDLTPESETQSSDLPDYEDDTVLNKAILNRESLDFENVTSESEQPEELSDVEAFEQQDDTVKNEALADREFLDDGDNQSFDSDEDTSDPEPESSEEVLSNLEQQPENLLSDAKDAEYDSELDKTLPTHSPIPPAPKNEPNEDGSLQRRAIGEGGAGRGRRRGIAKMDLAKNFEKAENALESVVRDNADEPTQGKKNQPNNTDEKEPVVQKKPIKKVQRPVPEPEDGDDYDEEEYIKQNDIEVPEESYRFPRRGQQPREDSQAKQPSYIEPEADDEPDQDDDFESDDEYDEKPSTRKGRSGRRAIVKPRDPDKETSNRRRHGRKTSSDDEDDTETGRKRRSALDEKKPKRERAPNRIFNQRDENTTSNSSKGLTRRQRTRDQKRGITGISTSGGHGSDNSSVPGVQVNINIQSDSIPVKMLEQLKAGIESILDDYADADELRPQLLKLLETFGLNEDDLEITSNDEID